MNHRKLGLLRSAVLFFLLPGLAGLVWSAVVSTSYLQTMPRYENLESQQLVPRNIHGVIVYQMAEENRRLDLLEYTSVSVFLLGLVLAVVYLEKWSAARAEDAEELGNSVG